MSKRAATLAGPVLARVLCWLPPTHVSVGQAGGASQCSSGTFRFRQRVLGQSPGSAAGKTGTPLLHTEEIQNQKRRLLIHLGEAHSAKPDLDSLTYLESCVKVC